MDNLPKLDIYYIDIKNEQKDKIVGEKPRLKIKNKLAQKTLDIISDSGKAVESNFKKAIKSVNESYLDKYKLIDSQTALKEFENGNGNDWTKFGKGLGKRQFYIRHPKIKDRKILIEANTFAEYVEQEQKHELINYILSHCKAKKIYIDKVIKNKSKGKLGVSWGLNNYVDSDVDFKSMKGDYYKLEREVSFFNDIKLSEPLDNYYWLDKFLMDSIDALSKGGILQQKYFMDYKFGLDAKVCNEIGMNLKTASTYQYNIYIEC